MGIFILAFVSSTFLLAGFVKGVVGLGLPTIAMGLLAAAMTPAQGAALLVVPSFFTNVWQAAGPQFMPLLRRLWPMLLGISVWTWCMRAWAGAGLRTGDNGAQAVQCFGGGRRALLLDATTTRLGRRLCGRTDGRRWQIRLDLYQLAGSPGPDAEFNRAMLDHGALVCRGGQSPPVEALDDYTPRQTSKLFAADGFKLDDDTEHAIEAELAQPWSTSAVGGQIRQMTDPVEDYLSQLEADGYSISHRARVKAVAGGFARWLRRSHRDPQASSAGGQRAGEEAGAGIDRADVRGRRLGELAEIDHRASVLRLAHTRSGWHQRIVEALSDDRDRISVHALADHFVLHRIRTAFR